MGPSRDVKTLLREKDERIAALEARLEAYTARTSTAHTRLLKTIDVLDTLRSQHALDISAVEHAKTKLGHDVERLRTVVRDLEVEKDELKDVVEDLIERVQVSNEWSAWPYSRMHITKHADQAATTAVVDSTTRTGEAYDNDLLAYANAIIARLRTELEFERQSHRKTVHEANLRIEELEANVAVREAELENYITSAGEPRDPTGRPVGKKLAEPTPLSDEDCLHFLESNTARNRSLEIEIRHIAEKLERARMITEPPTPTRASRPRSASPLTKRTIAQLDDQIRALTTHMDALVSERTTLIEAAAMQRRSTHGNVDTFHDVLRVEGECVRLQAEVDDLGEQLRRVAQFRSDTSAHVAPLDEDITDESMDLASPLEPTIVSSPLHTDVDLVSFPLSPKHARPEQDVARVQAALDTAREDLAQKEETLAQLRAEMKRLQVQVQAHS